MSHVFQTSALFKDSVSECFFNIAILPISFANAKWMWMLLESLMTELYIYIIFLDDFPGRLKQAKLVLSSSAKSC